MQVTANEKRRIHFSCFEVDLASCELHKDGHKIKLQEKPFQVLALLIEAPGEVVTREEFRQQLWPSDTFVDFEHGINTAVRKLREALEDRATEPRYIETLPKHGYRFIAPVEEEILGKEQPPLPGGRPIVERATSSNPSHRWYSLLPKTGLVVMAVLLVVLTGGVVRDRMWQQPQRPRQDTVVQIASLAVLPFENLSGDPSKDYFADGFTDELITDLAQEAPIRIVSRSSVMRYKGSRKPITEIARELNVDAIVEGSVSLSDRQVRITAQLIHGPTDRHLWAHSYERDRTDLFSIQRDVATAIASLIGTKTGAAHFSAARAPSSPRRSD